MKPKLVILRGKPTSGKSTAFQSLKGKKKFKEWVLIDHPALKRWFEHIKDKELRKKALFAVLKEAMKEKKNILLEEMSEKTIKKYINYHIKKYNYQIITFQFAISLKEAYKRDVKRAKEKWHPFMGKKEIKKMHKMHDNRFDPSAILVDCNKLNKKQVVEFILKRLR
jgi:predicted kinase